MGFLVCVVAVPEVIVFVVYSSTYGTKRKSWKFDGIDEFFETSVNGALELLAIFYDEPERSNVICRCEENERFAKGKSGEDTGFQFYINLNISTSILNKMKSEKKNLYGKTSISLLKSS